MNIIRHKSSFYVKAVNLNSFPRRLVEWVNGNAGHIRSDLYKEIVDYSKGKKIPGLIYSGPLYRVVKVDDFDEMDDFMGGMIDGVPTLYGPIIRVGTVVSASREEKYARLFVKKYNMNKAVIFRWKGKGFHVPSLVHYMEKTGEVSKASYNSTHLRTEDEILTKVLKDFTSKDVYMTVDDAEFGSPKDYEFWDESKKPS